MDPTHPSMPWSRVFECFLLYCVQDAPRKITPQTTDQYVSQILKIREHRTGDYGIREGARSPLYNAVWAALEANYVSESPARLRARIPFTLPFLLWTAQYIKSQYQDDLFCTLLCACLAAAHAFSLRPGEFLCSPRGYPPEHYLNAATTVAWWGDEPYFATEVAGWPPGYPNHITSVLDARKNSKDAGGTVAVAANPVFASDPTAFCCVAILTDYIRGANLKPGEPLFVWRGVHLGTQEISAAMKTCAEHFGLDPKRVVPACIRKAVITQMDLNTPQLQRQLQGGWRSDAGERSYWGRLLQVADANQTAVHSPGGATVNVIRHVFATPSARSSK
jgi:hypothetical protein